MIKLYAVRRDEIYSRLDGIICAECGTPRKILRTANGKPYIEGNPLFFSISHSGSRGIIATCETPVGVDLEIFTERTYPAIEKRLCDKERAEITCPRDFIYHWTAREAFVKMRGLSVFETFKNTAYYGGNICFDGVLQPCEVKTFNFGYGAVAVCTEKEKS